MLTDDPFTPDVGQFEINIGGFMEDRDNLVVTAPIIDVNYGLIKNVQLTMATAYISSVDENGWDALELAVKWNFYSNELFSMAVSPLYVNYPVETIFNEGERYAISFPMNFQFNARWSLVLTPSYIYQSTADEHPELGTYLQYALERHNFYVELFMEESKDYDATFSLANFGYSWQYNDSVVLMLSVGREIRAEEREATIAYSGLQLVF